MTTSLRSGISLWLLFDELEVVAVEKTFIGEFDLRNHRQCHEAQSDEGRVERASGVFHNLFKALVAHGKLVAAQHRHEAAYGQRQLIAVVTVGHSDAASHFNHLVDGLHEVFIVRPHSNDVVAVVGDALGKCALLDSKSLDIGNHRLCAWCIAVEYNHLLHLPSRGPSHV